MVKGLLALRVLIRKHLEACSLVVVFVLIEDAIEVRELPRENIGSEKGCLRTENASSLSHGPDQRRKRSNYSSDESVPGSGLLHWKVHAKVADPDCIRNDPGIRCKLAVS